MQYLRHFIFLPAIAFVATEAVAANYTIEAKLEISSSPDAAWHVIGDFCDIDDWHPMVADCALKVIEGSLHRVLTMADGGEFVEKRIAVEPGLSYTYRLVTSPLPIERYTATVSMTRGTPTSIDWSGRLRTESPDVEATLKQFFEAGMAGIAKALAE